MIFSDFGVDVSPAFASVIFGILVGAAFGVAAQICQFCLRRGLVAGPDRESALGVWLFALFTALVATQISTHLGWIDLSEHRFSQADLPYAAVILGGISFGIGMVLTRGCVSRLTVLAGSGNLRALLVILVFAVVAHATLKGVLAPVRVALGSLTVDLGEAATADGLPGGFAIWTAFLSAVLLNQVWRSGASFRQLTFAAIIGLLVPLGWIGTGVFLYDDFDPIPLESISFTAPWASTLFWSIASTSIPAGFGTGFVGGVIAGSAFSALFRREARLVSFESPSQTLRYGAGGVLMGFGGVLAGGCTIGAGLSGVSSLSAAASLSLASMVIGALAADRMINRHNTIHVSRAVTPAE